METTKEVIGYELLTNLLRVASDHMKTKIYEKEQNPEMTQRTSGRNQLHCKSGSPPKRYDDSSPSKWREKKFEMEKPSLEPPPFSQPQMLRIINAPAVSTEDPEDAPWRKGETFSQPSSITKATIISPLPHSHEKEKYDIETKKLVPAGEMDCDSMHTASGWLNTDYYYLKNKTYNKRGNAGLNLQLSKSEKGRRWQHV